MCRPISFNMLYVLVSNGLLSIAWLLRCKDLYGDWFCAKKIILFHLKKY